MDTVQRQLSLLDRQLAGGIELYKQSLGKSPLLVCAASLIAGILLQDVLDVPIRCWLVLLGLCFTAAVVLFAVVRRNKPILVLASLACVCFACLGAVRLASFRQLQANDISHLVNEERTLATIRGVIVSQPYVDDKTNWAFSRFAPGDPSSSFYLKIDQVQTTTGPLRRSATSWAKAGGVVRVQVAEPVLDLDLGDYIQAYTVLSRFKGPANEGQFNVAQYLARRNVFVAATVKSREGIKVLHQDNRYSRDVYLALQRKLRRIATAALLGTPTPQTQSEGLLAALLLGTRRDIDSETRNAFRETGLLHFICLSGLHVGILVGIVWWLCRLVGLLKPWRAAVCMVWLGLFVLIVPPRAPILRAATICCVFCVSLIVRRRPNPLNTLALAAIILLLFRPTEIFSPGWQLSFAMVLGLLLFCKRIHFFLYEKITGLPWRKKAPKTRLFFYIISRPGPYLLILFSTGLTAWVAGAGILLYHFHTITPLACVWTVLVFPLVAAVLIVGFLKIIISLLVPGVAVVLSPMATGLSGLLIWVVKVIASLDISQVLIGSVPMVLILGYYGFVAFAGFAHFRRPVIKKRICIAAGLALVVFTGSLKWQRTHRGHLELVCLSVGHGQAILAALPGGVNVLFDAGSLTINDCGRRVAVPFLNFSGIKTIDAIAASHDDVDHINGIPEIIQDCDVRAVYANDAFLGAMDQWSTAGFLKDWLGKRGIEIEFLSEGIKVTSAAKVQMLWPTAQICRDEQLSDNDKSQVVLIEFAGRRILLCSDIQQFAQQKLVELYSELKADIVVVPHHGSKNSRWAGFLESIEPEILIFSCGRTQYEKYIFEVDEKIKPYYTARDGAVRVRVEKDGAISVDTYINSR